MCNYSFDWDFSDFLEKSRSIAKAAHHMAATPPPSRKLSPAYNASSTEGLKRMCSIGSDGKVGEEVKSSTFWSAECFDHVMNHSKIENCFRLVHLVLRQMFLIVEIGHTVLMLPMYN